MMISRTFRFIVLGFYWYKDSANRKQNKINLFIFYVEVQPILFKDSVNFPKKYCKKKAQKKKGIYHRHPIFINLKSNTMKNTVQK